MTESRGRRRRPALATLAAPALLVVLAAATIIGPHDETDGLALAAPDLSRVSEVRAALAGLPDDPLVLVGMDADLGTYPEIRTTVRALMADLRSRGASLAFISFSTEGRAVAAAELDRLREQGVDEGRLLDLGFVAGAEAGLVRSVGTLLPRSATGDLAGEVRSRGGGIAAFDLAVVVGGIDFGPRSWVEQVGTRLPALPVVAVAPTVAQPELAPYLRTGQLAALLATVRDGTAYTELVESQQPPAASGAPPPEPIHSSLAMLIGMLVALAVIGRNLLVGGRQSRRADGEEPGAEADE
jgi:hypothetical protein